MKKKWTLATLQEILRREHDFKESDFLTEKSFSEGNQIPFYFTNDFKN
jgi:hypothetical protein